MTSKSYEKMIDEIGKMSVLELADFVKAIEEKFGVSAAVSAMGAPAAAAAAAPVAEEKSSYKVILEDGGPEKIKSIKALRSVTTLGLTEAKALVENAGPEAVIADSASKEDAKKIKEALEAAGAKVKLV
jgi:large subunit ribosomal protein L7/L12